MQFIFKYIAFFFLFNNVVFSLVGLYEIANTFFIVLMTFCLIITISSFKILKEIIFDKSFLFFFILNILNIIYYVFTEFGDYDSFKYLSARFIQFSIFSFSIYSLEEDFPNKFIKFLKYLTLGSLFISIIFNFPDIESRYMGVFFNPNEFSIVMVVGFALFLYTQKRSLTNYIFLVLFLLVIVLSGSRSAIIGLAIAILSYIFHFKSKNLNNIILIFISLFTFYFIGDQNNALKRIFETDQLINRKYEYLYAIDTFLQKPLFGHGLKNYAYIDFSLIQFDEIQIDYGAHNGYLSILVQYGIFFSILFYSVLIYYIVKVYKKKIVFFGENVLQTKFLFFLITYTLVNGMFENTLIGINFFQSNLFWITLSYFIFILYKKDESNSISN